MKATSFDDSVLINMSRDEVVYVESSMQLNYRTLVGHAVQLGIRVSLLIVIDFIDGYDEYRPKSLFIN